MSDFRRLSDQELADMALRLRALEWPRDPDDVPAIAAAFDWTVESLREMGARLGTRFGIATGNFEFEEGRAVHVRAAVCSDIDRESAEERAWLQDVFAESVEAVSAALGPPTHRLPGETPEVRWRGENSTVSVLKYSVIVDIALSTNEYIDEYDRDVYQEL
ncbi:hypothetical protein Acsp03_04710 [Actinomadura sp. NBRC 104412]|uniref:DUF6301 family protein n=1 Tax=Actinomadura sp. NBRC 104412 TaxID=3032203 RepID=UPI0024A0FE44|nr:DUF6301 family protein [Actinomadura sp. NBRC 104412]GLZ03004.1 hypothetical protein Acsp03_04710 [Actinomadura sp. NBRC 104412]